MSANTSGTVKRGKNERADCGGETTMPTTKFPLSNQLSTYSFHAPSSRLSSSSGRSMARCTKAPASWSFLHFLSEHSQISLYPHTPEHDAKARHQIHGTNSEIQATEPDPSHNIPVVVKGIAGNRPGDAVVLKVDAGTVPRVWVVRTLVQVSRDRHSHAYEPAAVHEQLGPAPWQTNMSSQS